MENTVLTSMAEDLAFVSTGCCNGNGNYQQRAYQLTELVM